MAFCRNCGSEIPEGTKYCINCGTSFETDTEEKKETVSKDEAFYTSDLYMQKGGKGIKKIKNKSNKRGKILKLLILFIAVVFIIKIISPEKNNEQLAIPENEEAVAINTEVYTLSENNSEVQIEIEENDAVEEPDGINESFGEEDSFVEEKEPVNGVNTELKDFLDSYEAFVDEYIDFMKEYKKDPSNVVSMLSEYTEMMKKYADFADKVESYDSDEMSVEDAKYYLEAVNRCSQKMLEMY